MSVSMKTSEKKFMKKMLLWDQKKASVEVLVNLVFLIIGTLVVLTDAYFTYRYIYNHTSFWVIMPGYVIGILLLLIYLVGDKRIKERRHFASILRKMLTSSKK
jgi:ABC-type dipeptide/oligopeptide/nickel transport system permease subunit